MQWNSMLRENMKHEQLDKQWGVDHINSRDEDGLLGEPIDDDENCIKTRGGQEFLNEVYRNGLPWIFWNWELLKELMGVMSLRV